MKTLLAATASIKPMRWRWLLFGCVLQGVVLLEDTFTPLGFAHGLLYALPVAFGALSRSLRAIWALVALGVAFALLGMYASDGRLIGVSDHQVWFNRVLGIGWVVLAGIVASVVLRLMRHQATTREALENSASLLEMSSAVGQLGGWRIELGSGKSHWSREVFRLMGQPDGVTPDLDSIIDSFVPEDRQRIRHAFETCAADGTPYDQELRVENVEGGDRWLRVVGEAVRNTGGEITWVQGAIQDIDRHKRSELALQRSRAELRLMTETLPMMVWVSQPDGGVSYMNQFGAEYVGADNAALLGSGWLQFLHPDDRDETAALWQEALHTGKSYETEFRVRRADGMWRCHFARAVHVDLPTGGSEWYGTAMDVQALHDERTARTRLATRLADTMESVAEGIVILDHDWRVSFLNAHAAELMGWEREEMIGRNLWDELPPGRESVFKTQYERCVRDQVPVRFEAEYGPLAKLFEVSASPADGGVVVYFRDVTEQRRLAQQLDQAQRMDALGQLTGGVAHDFNNVLTVILGNAEILSEQYTDGGQHRLMANMIVSAAKRGAEMTQRLLAVARKQVLQPEASDVNRLLRQFGPLLERALGEHIEIEMVHAAGLWPAMVDRGQLEVALLNLAVNARDAMPRGGRLTIETSNARLDDAYAAQHTEVAPGQYVMVAVSDTGHGIAPDILAQVFEPFFTTKDVGKGTGLGMAMVYGFAKQSHGHVAIYSEVDRGTTIRLYLPRIFKGENEAPGEMRSSTVRSQHGELILLVEDDEMVRNFATSQVVSLGYRVVQASTGTEALKRLAENPDVALLFTDVVMPGGMTGRELADAAQALRPSLPVLYTSGYTENAIVHHGRLDPGVLLLGKPYRRTELAEKLQQALTRNVAH